MNFSHSALNPIGPQAGHIYNLWLFLFWLCAIVWVLVAGFLIAAVYRRKRNPEAGDRGLTRGVAIAGTLTVLALFAVLIVSVSTGSVLSARPSKDLVSIEIVGNQWWWKVIYEDAIPQNQVTTANEIHVPVGVPVILKTTSSDVIHSVFMPNLYGKIDAIPSHVNTTWFRADREGTYRGICAEFCGPQHAHMGMLVIAEVPDKFQAWLAQQRQAAASPLDQQLIKGQKVFLAAPCVLCHAIRGTDAGGQNAPDLTHVASRQTIAAATLANTHDNLSHWIQDSQDIKPGNHMPAMNIKPGDMDALVAYLGSLK